MKKLRYLCALLLVLLILVVARCLPIISGYGAKVLCSAVFVGGRNPDSAQKQDLGIFPFNLARFTVDPRDSSVTGSVWGLASSRAIFRRGLGAVLVNGLTEANFRQQAARWTAQTPDSLLPTTTALDTIDWPDGDRVKDTAPMSGLASTSPMSGLASASPMPGLASALDREIGAHGTRAIVVLYQGRIVGERYAPGFGPNTPLTGWSMTKSITSALLGILVRQGKLNIDSAAPIAAWQNDDRGKITIRDLMRMRSGLRWWEFYFGPSRCTQMLFREKDMGGYAARSSLRHPPGTVFNYSSGTANILSLIIRGAIDTSGYHRWPYEQLFHRIGMRHTVLEPDAGGTFVGSSYCYATARDWARFGLFYLHDGIWDGQRILPKGWVDAAKTGPGIYGALWWLNGGRWPRIPADCFCADGYEGQYICVIPSRDLVVVRLALDHTRANPDRLVGDILEAIPTRGAGSASVPTRN